MRNCLKDRGVKLQNSLVGQVRIRNKAGTLSRLYYIRWQKTVKILSLIIKILLPCRFNVC